MPCIVKKTLETARDTGSFLVAQVKANQQTLHDGNEVICAAERPVDSAPTIDRNRHGRQEHRLVETFDATGRLGPDRDGLIVAAARVTRLTWHKDTASGRWLLSDEISTSCAPTAPKTSAGNSTSTLSTRITPWHIGQRKEN